MNTGKRAIVSEFDGFLRTLAPEAQAQLRRYTIDAGQPICAQWDAIQTIFMLCDGYAHVASDHEASENYRSGGSLLGVEELLRGEKQWPVHISAVTPCEVIELDAEVLLGSLNNPNVVMALLGHTLYQRRTVQRQLLDALSK